MWDKPLVQYLAWETWQVPQGGRGHQAWPRAPKDPGPKRPAVGGSGDRRRPRPITCLEVEGLSWGGDRGAARRQVARGRRHISASAGQELSQCAVTCGHWLLVGHRGVTLFRTFLQVPPCTWPGGNTVASCSTHAKSIDCCLRYDIARRSDPSVTGRGRCMHIGIPLLCLHP